ncbi:MAG: hypothetical protein PHF63_06370 [Herbinix sp.]|nr:hypothetical protein [Herbinix sp.]
MAKNKNNGSKNSANSSSKTSTTSSNKNSMGGSMKDTHAQVPDKGPSRSGPGGE